MKKAIFCSTLLVSLAFLAGCDRPQTQLSERTRQVIDMGRVPLPNSSHQLHGYRLDNGSQHDHFVYVVEDAEGQVVAGAGSNQKNSSGKSTKNTAVTSKLDASPKGAIELDVKIRCESIEECQQKLQLLEQSR